MKISKKAEYALRAITAMGRAAPGTTFSIQDIATRERIPLKFLEQILLTLKNAGILRSKRGVGGGYQTQRSADKITLGDIIEAIDGPIDPMPAATLGPPARTLPTDCGLTKTMSLLRENLRAWLHATTIADIIERDRPRGDVSFEI
jgi:Rrf2 family transcriptional regulator, iron-sulfur cluster assembly transcription factor